MDKLGIVQAFRLAQVHQNLRGNIPPHEAVSQFLKDCERFILDCDRQGFSRLVIEGVLYYVNIAFAFNSYCEVLRQVSGLANENALVFVGSAIGMLEALVQNDVPLDNADGLRAAGEKGSIRGD